MKKAIVILALVAALVMAGCSSVSEGVSNAVESAAQLLSGNVTGEVGKAYRTQWFSFEVKSIQGVRSYAGYEPEEGNILIDVVVAETNIFDRSIPMGTFDFFVDHDSFPEYIWPIDPIDDTMMPEYFDLDVDESVEYHMVFEVPDGINGFTLYYVEVNEDEELGVTFRIDFTI